MLLFYTDEINPRIEYTAQLIFNQILGIEVAFTVRSSEFLNSELPKLNYSYEKFGDEMYIKPHRFMHCKALIQPNIQPVWHEGEKYFFESSKDSVFPFDPLAASFFLVSRYEEYIETEKGKYKRYPAEKSILYKYNLLEKPVVNIWARMLADKLKERFPELKFPQPKFDFLSTIDVDNAWAYSNKGFWRGMGALVKSISQGQIEEAKKRIRVWQKKETDPYDTYSYIDSVFKGNENKVIFFFLLGDYKRFDKNISPSNRSLQNLIRETNKKYTVGIHPSYSSSKKKRKLKLAKEIERLENITGKKPDKSRQHFLRLKIPRSYRRLLKNGIREDYTMGYSTQTGFRAGICTPFYFYDVKKEKATNLKVYPFQVMDVTLRDYLGLSAEEALKKIETLMNEVKKTGGIFSSVWHNETVNDQGHWKDYREVFEKMNKKGFEWANEQ
ncbi:MAG TPA: polysaccharide deacetylase family protein [Tangfeifania sp.]|nr:polysaccharide deacetylase family protein [Tangfeifania sp.]